MANLHRLVLVRHAKSDWPAGFLDANRPLAERGIRDCEIAAEFFKDTEFDLAIVSSASRTQETFKRLNLSNLTVQIEPQIYEAGLGTLLAVINQQTVKNLLVVGHSPGMPSLAWFFAKDHKSDAAKQIRIKYPTLGIAVLESELPFSQWNEATAELVSFNVPRANPAAVDID